MTLAQKLLVSPGCRMMSLSLLFAAGPLPGIGAPASAEGVGPSEVYQVVAHVNRWLAAFDASPEAAADQNAESPLAARSPRHCYFLARSVHSRAQGLREKKEQQALALPAAPSGQPTPGNVKDVAQSILESVSPLKASFPEAKEAAAPELEPGKKPADCYGALLEAQNRLFHLGAAPFGPGDCFRAATQVGAELEAIRKTKGVTSEVPAAEPATGKKPADCYAEAMLLLKDLAALAADPGFTVPNGVVVPAARGGEIRPGHVLELLDSALADSWAMQKGEHAALPPEGEAAKKTPSDVFSQIAHDRALVKSLMPGGAGQ